MHFICQNGQNVGELNEGVFATKFWNVSFDAARSVEFVALHESRESPSYRQGEVVRYAQVQCDGKLRYAFVINPTPTPVAWEGDGKGERGYGYEAGRRA